MNSNTSSPVSYLVHVARLPKTGTRVKIEADAEQLAALADAHGLRSVTDYRVTLDVTAWKKGGIKVVGEVKANIVQDCIVTLEPVEQLVAEEVSGLFLPEGSKLAKPKSAEGEILLDAEGEDGPELFTGDTVDVGQLAEEFFALGIDPYPRKGGVALETRDVEDEEPRGPLYEKLAALAKKS